VRDDAGRPSLVAYKLSRSVRFVPDLPKTSMGNGLRRELKTLGRRGGHSVT
jgi:acyl-coenzyme A synthetase/AMP-(fatty) acid ligase